MKNGRDALENALATRNAMRNEWKSNCIAVPASLGGGKIYRIEDLQWVVERNNKTLYYSDVVWCLKDVMRYAVGNGQDIKTLKDILERVRQVEKDMTDMIKAYREAITDGK